MKFRSYWIYFKLLNLKLPASFGRYILLTIVPATVNEAKIYYDNLSSLWRIELNLKVFDGAKFSLDFVRFYLNGPSTVTGIIYTLLCDEVDNIILQKNNDVLYGVKTNVFSTGLMRGK